MKKLIGLTALAVTLLAAGCSTTYYQMPSDYKSFRSEDGLASSTQSAARHDMDNELVTTYDDEFFYDDEGNVIRRVQTEYFDWDSNDGPKFHEWEITYKKIGDKIVPQSLAVNGVVYAEVEYEILPVEAEGEIILYGPDPYFEEVTSTMSLYGSYTQVDYFRPAVSHFSIGFPDDGEFVKEVEVFNRYRGFSDFNALTLGYDNIVLTKLSYSYEKVVEGISQTDIGSRSETENLKKMAQGSTVEYVYEWETIAEKICMTSHTYNLDLKDQKVTFTAEVDYDSSGRRIAEEWTLIDPDMSGAEEEPLVVYSQELVY
jgi:hypothetical protein